MNTDGNRYLCTNCILSSKSSIVSVGNAQIKSVAIYTFGTLQKIITAQESRTHHPVSPELIRIRTKIHSNHDNSEQSVILALRLLPHNDYGSISRNKKCLMEMNFDGATNDSFLPLWIYC